MVSPLLPLLLSTAYFGSPDRPTSSKLSDQDFGLGLRPEQLLFLSPRYDYISALDRALLDVYYRPLPELFRSVAGGGVSSIQLDKDSYRVTLDVQQFKPEEIEVKVADRQVIVTAKHEEKQDEHGYVSRQFVRRYALPKGVEPEAVTSEISSDGVLTIRAPVKQIEDDSNVRKVKIELTGKPALKVQSTAGQEGKDEETTTASSTQTPQTESTTPEK